MIFTPNQIIYIPTEFNKYGNVLNKTSEQKVGLVVDAYIKSLMIDRGFKVPSDEFNLFDFESTDNIPVDIKSYCGKSVTLSHREYKFAFDRMINELDTYYLVFEQLVDHSHLLVGHGEPHIQFKGCVSFINLYENGQFYRSDFEIEYSEKSHYFWIKNMEKYFVNKVQLSGYSV